MLLNMDCFGRRSQQNETQPASQQFLSADFNRSIHIHHTSLDLDDDSRVYGGSQGKLLMVAEGMGPKGSGQRASTVAVDAVTEYLLNAFRIADQASVGDSMFETKLKAALEHCQKSLHREGDVIEAHQGMGAEVTAAYVVWPNVYVVHAGRTSCCLWRDGQLIELSPKASTEVVGGTSPELVPAFTLSELRLGDKLVLCSKSLRDAVTDFDICDHLSHDGAAAEICNRLTSSALDNGCEECTLVVACFDKGAAASSEERIVSVEDSCAKTKNPAKKSATKRAETKLAPPTSAAVPDVSSQS